VQQLTRTIALVSHASNFETNTIQTWESGYQTNISTGDHIRLQAFVSFWRKQGKGIRLATVLMFRRLQGSFRHGSAWSTLVNDVGYHMGFQGCTRVQISRPDPTRPVNLCGFWTRPDHPDPTRRSIHNGKSCKTNNELNVYSLLCFNAIASLFSRSRFSTWLVSRWDINAQMCTCSQSPLCTTEHWRISNAAPLFPNMLFVPIIVLEPISPAEFGRILGWPGTWF